MLESLITSKTRIKILLKFFLNPRTRSYLRELADEFGESTNGIRIELNRLENAGILESSPNGRTRLFEANKKHPLFPEISGLVKKFTGIDRLVEEVISRLGNIKLAFVTGDYARGSDTGIIDVVIVGDIDRSYYDSLITKAETFIDRKIRSIILNEKEYKRFGKALGYDEAVVVWGKR